MEADHSKFEIELLKLINPETNKIWTITVDGESITTQLDNRKPKTITDEFPDLKARQLIMGQMRKGFVYSSLEADVWNPCYRTYINKVLKLRTSKKPVHHEKSIDNAAKVTKLSSH